ncbi:TolC family protein [Flavobacterium cellulosilyticum]|uniref:TolC family protein n=1 Tax=Flavobacterium cellulosilyticum TaxID=2541731 RepID=A0A4R5CJV2_9FLAO|nr:TolC family protein [Flavobacterium cellulosilyticum]TDD99419.1 TolC family protein [Flavobacterium cellulosilyticum]
MKQTFYLFLALLAFTINAQETKQQYSFSLEQAIDYALKYNRTVLNSGRNIESAFQKKWETTAAGLPQIAGNISYQNNFSFMQQGVTGGGPFGGSENEIQTFAFGTKHNMNAALTLSQLLFDGSYIVALQASKTYLKYYENAKIKTDLDVKEMTINAYGNVLLAQESIAILNKNKVVLDKTLADTKEILKNGLIEEENVEQLQITLSSVNSQLNNTTRLLDVTYKMLKITLGLDINDDLTVTDKLENLTQSNLGSVFTNTEFNIENNINYQIATNYQQQRELEYKLQKSKALPTLGANVNLGYNSFANEFRFFNQNQKWLNYSNLGVGLSIPIFSSLGRSAKTQQAKIALEQAKTDLVEADQKLKLLYASAKSEFEFSIEEYATAKTNLALAERIEKKNHIKFTEGISTSFDYTDAQRQLYTAQQKYLQTMVDVINKKAAFEKVINKQ